MSAAVEYPGVKGKCYMVTGASSGIGRETAILLSRLGAQVILLGRNLQRLEETFSVMSGEGHVILAQDLRDISNMRTWFDEAVIKVNKPLSGLAHCAGESTLIPVRGYTKQAFSTLFEEYTNVSASILHAACFSKHRSENLSIAVMSSISTLNTFKSNGFYAASRAALDVVVRYFALECVQRGVRCNIVVGGHMLGTKMTDEYSRQIGPELIKSLNNRYPLGFGRPQDAANALVFFLGDCSRWITGSSLVVDGGEALRRGEL